VQDWLRHPVLWLVVAVGIGLFLGSQVTGVSQRYAKLAIALSYAFILLRFPTYIGAGVFLLLYAFPASIWIGNTNFIFTTFLAVLWLIRAGLGRERVRGTYLDLAILAYLAAHLLSFVNVTSSDQLAQSLLAVRHLVLPIVFYYVLVNVGRSEEKLRFLVRMFTVATAMVYVTAFMQRFAPGVEFLPRWYITVLGANDIFEAGVQRIGGVLTHALLGDLAAFTCLLQVYLAIRSKGRPLPRTAHWLMAAVSIYVVSLTGNRGALITLLAGGVYFLWVFRRELSWKRALVGFTAFLGLLMIGEKTLGRFQGNITLLSRLASTYVERGIPDTRRAAWQYVWQRITERPILGHGPYYSLQANTPGERPIWPHNAYLFYLFSIGLVGLPTYLYLVWRVLKRTWDRGGFRVGEAPFARGVMVVFHIGVVQFLIGQMRTDHQRGDVYIYYMWILFGMGVLAREVWREMKTPAPAR
jgi:O-antigen ligase